MSFLGESVKSLIQSFERKVSENSLVKSSLRIKGESSSTGGSLSRSTTMKSPTKYGESQQDQQSRTRPNSEKPKSGTSNSPMKLTKTYSGITTPPNSPNSPKSFVTATETATPRVMTNKKSEFTLIPVYEEPSRILSTKTTKSTLLPDQLQSLYLPNSHQQQNHQIDNSDNQSSLYSEISDLTDTASWASSKRSFHDQLEFMEEHNKIRLMNINKGFINEDDNDSFTTLDNTQELMKLKDFLSPLCHDAVLMNYYLGTLVRANIRNIEELTTVCREDEFFLLNLGFDYVVASDIAEKLLKSDKSISVQSRSSKSPSKSPSKSSNALSKAESSPSLSSKALRETPPQDIAKLYYKLISSNHKQSYNELLKHANVGNNMLAKGFVMRIYALGQAGFEKNLTFASKIAEEILDWLKETSSQNQNLYNMYAKYLLGVCYSEGLVLPKNSKEAFLWYKKSAEQGYDAAQALIGHCFYTGQGVLKDSVEAVRWYRLSAQQGFAAAQCNLGICYELGEGVKRDISEAVKWYKLAAAQGNCSAQYNLGLSLECGVGLKHNQSESLKYYKAAAEQGHAGAQYKLGTYYFSESENLELLEEEAYYWLEKSVKQGNVPAHCQLGLCFERGIGIEQDIQKAIYYYQIGADKGDALALYHLAHCYYTGLGLEKDDKIAFSYYLRSAEKGHPPAQNNLGYCYFAGTGAVQDYALALKWYKTSAENGYAQAQFNLGYCFEQGFTGPKKLKEAAKWYALAAEQGHAKAEAALKRIR